MARQGKMHSSPFHVETQQYMYAIEHEVEPQYNTKEIPDCEYIDSTKTMCKKWNSGTLNCKSYSCPFYNKDLRRQVECDECAYYYKEYCYRQDNAKKQADVVEAAYCVFFYSKEKNKDRYNEIKKYCARYYYTQQIQNHENLIKKREKNIKQCEKELVLDTISESDRNYLNNKVLRKTQEIIVLEKELRALTNKLSKLGDRAETLPWTLSGRNTKKKQKNKKHH